MKTTKIDSRGEARRWLPHFSFLIVIAWLIAGVAAFVWFMFYPSLSTRGDSALPDLCGMHVRAIAAALQAYADTHDHHYPDRLERICDNDRLPSEFLVCPSAHEKPARGPTTQAVQAELFNGGHISYVYCGAGLSTPVSPETVLLYEPISDHDNVACFLYGDGHEEFLTAGAAAYWIVKLKRGENPPQPPTSDERAEMRRQQ